MSADYDKTLNLPKTDFPMRAALAQREPDMLTKLYQDDIYGEMLKKNRDKTPFILHDGPPFSNGNIHMGHAMNRVLKDIIVRYKAMTGHYTPFTPGWDNHGMPIESAIIKQTKLNRKELSIFDFREKCHAFAWDFVCKQREQCRRLGVLADWENPYLTMSPQFEAEEVKVFGDIFSKGYIYKGLKPVYWCPHDETALAEAEIEYAEDKCTSIYVKFKVKDHKGKLSDPDNTYFVIWTTTPWTLPGNLAISVNPASSYVAAKLPNGDRYIVAEDLLETTMKATGVEGYEVTEHFKGRDLEYMTAQHPFLERDSLVCLADYVTMENGTGCVHTAPGFGADDYMTGRKYNLELIAPVDDRGIQTELAGRFAGMYYEKSNAAIVDHLRETGALVAAQEMIHQYPHCWRCKHPIIFRATPQWFCSVEAFREASLDAIKSVRWLNSWGEDRISAMVGERDDWCISRQRHWGLPIPVFYCADCGEALCDDTTTNAVSTLFAAKGSNAWYDTDAADILPDIYVCTKCGGKHFTKETDTLDGWFDSGSTSIASLKLNNPDHWPADLYIEGPDQYRGWFQSSLLIGVATQGRAPYKSVLNHGWTVDGEGKAMHKSTGNGVDPADIIKTNGADILRLWVSSADYKQDVRISDGILKQLSQAYLKIRNTSRFILGNLDGFDPSRLVAPGDMSELDSWIVTKLGALLEKVTRGYENYEFHSVYHAIYNFCVVELSNVYLDIVKDRLYCEQRDGLPRRSAQTAMYLVLDALTRAVAPILSFTADEIWQAMPHRDGDDVRNVVLNDIHAADVCAAYYLSDADTRKWDGIIELRDQVNAELERARADKLIGKPLEAAVALTADGERFDFLQSVAELLPSTFIVSEVQLERGADGIAVSRATGEKCVRCWTHRHDVGQAADHPGLCLRCATVVEQGV